MGAIGFVVFRANKTTVGMSEKDKLNVKKHKRFGYAILGAQIIICLYFLLKHYEIIDELIFWNNILRLSPRI